MSRSAVSLTMVVLALGAMVAFSGCGSSGGGGGGNNEQATIVGQVNAGGDAANYQLVMDGAPVPGAVNADGTYEIRGVPPGSHTIAVIGPDGMTGGYTVVDVEVGEEVEAPDIVPVLGGQIAGIVTVSDENGIRALAGVEVTAQPALMIIMNAPKDIDPNIYPPPDLPELPTLSTFTEEDGSYALKGVPEGEYIVTVAVPDYENAYQYVWVSAGATTPCDFQLRPVVQEGIGTVQGTVSALVDGNPVPLAGAMVTIYVQNYWAPVGGLIERRMGPKDGEEGEGDGSTGDGDVEPILDMIAPPWFSDVNTLTDSQGRYTLNAPSGYCSIEVYHPDYQSVWEDIVINADEVQTRDYTLQPWDVIIDDPVEPPVDRTNG